MKPILPIVIVFPPAAELSVEFQRLIAMLSLPMARCNGINQLPALLDLYPESTPVICMPFVLNDGRSGVNETLQIRNHAQFRGIKILGLLTLLDKISLHAFFGAGADIVLQPPFDIDLISLQLHALAKNSAEQRELYRLTDQDRDITRSAMRFLDTTRDGVIIIDDSSALVVANRAAERILALNSDDLNASFALLSPQFSPFLESHRKQEHSEQSLAEIVSSAEVAIQRSDGRTIRLFIRIMSLKGSEHQRVGFAIGVGDLSIPRQLANKLINQERLRTLTLTLAATTLELLKTPSLGVPGHPLKLAEHCLLQSKNPVLLSHVMTPLLEILDLALPTNSEIRINLRDDARILSSQADLFQLLGSLLLYAADRAGSDGETSIESRIQDNGENLAIIFTYTAHELIEPISGDYYVNLLQGDHGRFLSSNDSSVQTLSFAHKQAQKLGIQIEAMSSSKWSGKIRVILPCEI
jgi:PAS domain S-box-containing protein